MTNLLMYRVVDEDTFDIIASEDGKMCLEYFAEDIWREEVRDNYKTKKFKETMKRIQEAQY